MTFKILLAGQKHFGAAVFTALRGLPGVEIVAVSAPMNQEKPDRLTARAGDGYVQGEAQDEELATWEPSIDRAPAYRPELLMIGCAA